MARALLSRVDPKCLVTPAPVPIHKILQQVMQDTGLKYGFADLGPKNLTDLRGITRFRTGEIILDETLKDDKDRLQFLLFTIAHELGHWLIQRHQPIFLTTPGIEAEAVEDEVGDFFLATRGPQTTRQWVEWQANQFASSLILPYEALLMTMKSVNESRGNFGERSGRIYINKSREGRNAARAILQEISLKFMVSWRQVEIRLATLGYLQHQIQDDEAHPLFQSGLDNDFTLDPDEDLAESGY